jgi:hypothetical protein
MANKYKLVNPYIKGEFESKLSAKNSIDAAKVFYKNLSEHFNNNVPTFYFTIQKGGSGNGKFYHFKVKETKKNDSVDYSIKPFEIEGESDSMKSYLGNFEKFKGRYNGGAKKRKGSKRSSRKRSSRKSSSSEGSSSDDFYHETKSYVPVTNQPIYYMYYDPLLYNVNSVYIPTWYPYVNPYFELNSRYLIL